MAGRPPRRAAAIRCTQKNSSILNTVRGRPGPIPAPLPPRAQPVLEHCVYCQQDIDIDQDEIEMCKNCRHPAHHHCATAAIGPNDRQCRDLCGYTPPTPQGHALNPNCPLCHRTFRLNGDEIVDRWINIFNTHAWRTYIRRRQGMMRRYPHQMNPSIDGTNPFFNQVYQPDATRFVCQVQTQAQANDPDRTPYISHPNQLIWSASYNNGTGAPYRFNHASYAFYQRVIHPTPRQDPVFRNQWFVVHPSVPQHPADDPSQFYMFSELNILMHSDRPVWKRFCKMFDNLRLNLNFL